jgi:hypothetical protein
VPAQPSSGRVCRRRYSPIHRDTVCGKAPNRRAIEGLSLTPLPQTNSFHTSLLERVEVALDPTWISAGYLDAGSTEIISHIMNQAIRVKSAIRAAAPHN